MVSVNNNLLKDCFNLYGNQSLYNNYSKIANKYYKSYKENKDKKYYTNQEKLREDVKKWLFSQSLETRMKICTVENEFYGKSLYQMLLYTKMDKSMLFKPKLCFFNDEDDNNNQFSKNITNINNFNNFNTKGEDRFIYPSNNTNIKLTKTNKAGKKTEAPKLGYSQSPLNEFKDEEIKHINFGNYFTFQSYRNLSLPEANNINNYEKQNIIDISTEDLINNIIFFSVHHRYFPDCFTLSPEFLLEKEKFENCFNKLGNSRYFCSLIQSYIINGNNKNQKQYSYMFPDWFQNKNNNECLFSITQYAITFFEQVIMIKYLLNKSDKKEKIYSLLDEQALNRFFADRKCAINYMKKNYNNENKINILKELEIENHYKNLMMNNEKMKYVNYFKNLNKKLNHDDKFKNSPFIIESILENPYSNKLEEKFNKMKNIQKPKNNKNIYNNSELTLDEIIIKLTNILKNNNDNIYFVDYLLFQNLNILWKSEYFLQGELFEKLSNLIIEQNFKELIYDSKQSKSSKPRHRKKNKKNHIIQPIQKEEEKNNNNNQNKIQNQNEYEGIFKDEEEELYAPYYLNANTEQKKLYLKIKGQNNNDDSEKEKIKQFISKEIILGIIIDNVFLTPLNSGLDFYEDYKDEDDKNDDIDIYKNNENKIYEKEEEYEIKEKEEKYEIKEKEKKNEEENEEKKERENEEKKEKEKEKEKEIEKEIEKEKENIKKNEDEEKDKISNNNNNIIDEEKENINIIKENNSNNIKFDINKSDSNISKENDLEKSDSLSLSIKSENLSSEIDKTTTTTNTIDNNNNNKNNEQKKDDINNNNKDNSKSKKKKEKEQTFFLFDTVKKKKKKTNHNSNNNALISNEFNIIVIKEPNRRLSFFDKMHNDIIKYETKVITLLNHGMKFKDFCIKEIKRIIQETFSFSNNYNIDVYGSYATGLMIEASDIDIKIKLNNGDKSNLDNLFETLCKKLENENKFDTINPISTASVPVIKLLLNPEKFIKGKVELENSFKQYKELSLFKHYIFDTNELTKFKIDVTFILSNNNKNNNLNNETMENNSENNNNNINNVNNIDAVQDNDKSIGCEMSSVVYVKEQIIKYPEVKFILRVLKRYFYFKKMNNSFLGGLSSYNLFLLLLSYAKFLHISPNPDSEIIENNNNNNKTNTNLGYFLFNFLYFFKCLNFNQCIIDINSPNIYDIYDIVIPEKAKEYNFGKSIVIIDPLTGVNASKSSYKIEEIQLTFSEAFDFFQNEKIKYDKEGKTKVSKNNNNKDIVMGLSISNKNDNNHGGGGVNIIEKFLGK